MQVLMQIQLTGDISNTPIPIDHQVRSLDPVFGENERRRPGIRTSFQGGDQRRRYRRCSSSAVAVRAKTFEDAAGGVDVGPEVPVGDPESFVPLQELLRTLPRRAD